MIKENKITKFEIIMLVVVLVIGGVVVKQMLNTPPSTEETSIVAANLTPPEVLTKFDSVKEMLETLRIYDNFKIVSENPPEIEIYVEEYPATPASVIDSELKRAIVENAYLTFIFTDADSIRIQAIAVQNGRHLSSRKISISRSVALGEIQKTFGVSSFDDIYTPWVVNGTWVAEFQDWTRAFKRAVYNDQGSPTLNVFFGQIGGE